MCPLMLAVLENLTLTNALLIAGLIAVGMAKLADYRGWSRSTALVRQENADLRERNATLQAEVERLDKADREKTSRIAVLESQIEELKKRDQEAVLSALAAHHATAEAAWADTRATNDAMAERHRESLEVWREIRDLVARSVP